MNANEIWFSAEQASDRKDFVRAEELYRKALTVDSHHVPSLIGLSACLSRRGAHCEAHEAVMNAYAQRTTVAPVLYALAQRLRHFREFEAVIGCLTTPRFIIDAPPLILAKATVMLSSVGAHKDAELLANAAVKRDPKNAAALHVRGNSHFFEGDFDLAEVDYEASLRADPGLYQNSWMLASTRKQTQENNHIARIEKQLLAVKPNSMNEVYLRFALHKELHDLERFDEAWAALEQGCTAKRKLLQYDLARDTMLFDRMAEVCNTQFLETTSPKKQTHTPIFIVGMHRSGTTLLERMLAGHSLIGDAGETLSFHAELELAVNSSTPEGLHAEFVSKLADADYDRIADGYSRRAGWLSRGKPYFTEKLPTNFLLIGFIAKAIPQARFLHLVRDPMDTCFSNLRTLFSGAAPYSYEQSELGGFFLLYRRLMTHWHTVLPGRVLDVNYDELVNDPQTMAERVAAHCGVQFEAGMVDITRSTGTIATPSATLVRQGFRRDRGQVWKPYAEHLKPLQAALAPLYSVGQES